MADRAVADRAQADHPVAERLVLVAHPQLEHSRVTRRLMQAALQAEPDRSRLAVRDLYALYPDFLIDRAAEQAALSAARLVVWLFPLQWYAPPPLLQLWLAEVFGFGWAYGPGGRALAGKALWVVSSTGGSAHSYQPEGHNRHPVEAFLRPQEQTAALAHMRWLPPLVLHGAHQADEAGLAAHARAFTQRLLAEPEQDGPADRSDQPHGTGTPGPGLPPGHAAMPPDPGADPGCEVPAEARPAFTND